MRDFDVCVLSRFPEIFAGFRESIDRDAPNAGKTVVWDRDATRPLPRLTPNWTEIKAESEFRIARNANMAWRSCNGDVIYAGDDTRVSPGTCQRLREQIYSVGAWDNVGILAPRVEVATPHIGRFSFTGFVPFIFVYIKREVIEEIGYMDERFSGYGCDDADYCYRTRRAGFKIAYANEIAVQHGVGSFTYASTFRKVKTEQQIWAEDADNWKLFAEKWGLQGNRVKLLNAVLTA